MIGTWGRCPKCNYIWDMFDTKCVMCGEPIEPSPAQREETVNEKRFSISMSNIGIYTFGDQSKTGPIPTYEFDLINFRDPMNKFPSLDGTSSEVQEWIKEDRRLAPIIHQCLLLAADHIDNGGKWLTFGFRDIHEKWISRAVANIVADALHAEQYKVAVMYG